jgi:lipoate---protein ligase
MQFLDLTLPGLAENLALDEALLQAADQKDNSRAQPSTEVLRVWQSNEVAVVVGRSSRVADEVDLQQSQQLGIPVLRRCSGGASVVIGPGCLLYSLLIDLENKPSLRMLDEVHRHVMERMLKAIQPILSSVTTDGTCDLVFNNRKFSGNSLKVGRNWTLYHGTILLEMNLSWLDRLLKHPPREPVYRHGRSHSEFVTNIGIDRVELTHALRRAWQAEEAMNNCPMELVPELVKNRYSQASWNHQR